MEMVRQPNDLSEGALQRLTSSKPHCLRTTIVGRTVRYMNPEYDMLVDRYLATIPMNDRMEVVQQIVRHISENVPILGLMYEARPTLLSNQLVNVDATTDTRNAHEWDVR